MTNIDRTWNRIANLVSRTKKSRLDIAAVSDASSCQTLSDIWTKMSSAMGSAPMLVDHLHGEQVQLNFKQVDRLLTKGAAALQTLGVRSGSCVSIFAENSHKWFVVDQAIMRVRTSTVALNNCSPPSAIS
jgi:long-subunit acyl-CoA synthetase (AMP-forming)